MELKIGGRKVFGTIEEERADKMLSLCATSEISERRLRQTLARHGRADPLITTALEYAKSLDFSKNHLKSSYLSHPLRVASFLVELDPGVEDALIATATLHNVPEVTDVGIDELRSRFGQRTADAVQVLLVDRKAAFAGIKDDYYRRIYAAGDPVALVKLLDKMDNLFVLCLNPDDRVRSGYLDEIREKLLPFARRYDWDLGAYLEILLDDAAKTGFSPPLRRKLDEYKQLQLKR